MTPFANGSKHQELSLHDRWSAILSLPSIWPVARRRYRSLTRRQSAVGTHPSIRRPCVGECSPRTASAHFLGSCLQGTRGERDVENLEACDFGKPLRRVC